MPFNPKPTRKKVRAVHRSLYMPETPAGQVARITRDNNASFNNMVISMIKSRISESGAKTKNEIENTGVSERTEEKTRDFKS